MNTRKIAIVMVICILVSAVSLTVSATTPEASVTPLWDNTTRITAIISFSGNTGTVESYIDGVTGVTNIVASVSLYYKNSYGEWIEVDKDWDYDVNQSYLAINETFIGTRGREYKIVVDATLTKNGVQETVSKSSTALCQGH